MTKEVFEATQKHNTEWAYSVMNVCFNCGYHYKEEGESFPSCHCREAIAPCEYEDDYEEDCDD